MKSCSKCHLDKDKSEFYAGFGSVCKLCKRSAAKINRAEKYKDPEHRFVIKQQNLNWKGAHRYDSTKFVRKLHELGYLPAEEKLSEFSSRLISPKIRDPLPQSFIGLRYLDRIFTHRFTAQTLGSLSFNDAFYDPDHVNRVLRYMKSEGKELNAKNFIANLKFFVRLPSHFLPETSSSILSTFANGKRVFDPFLGWGGRALGAAFSGLLEYSGTDLQRLTIDGCLRVWKETETPVQGEFFHSDFQETMNEFPSGRFDVIFTSPPFMDTEVYNTSLIEDWVNSIMKPLASQCIRILPSDGRVILHLQDRPGMKSLTIGLQIMQDVGFVPIQEFKYGRTPGQKVVVFQK